MLRLLLGSVVSNTKPSSSGICELFKMNNWLISSEWSLMVISELQPRGWSLHNNTWHVVILIIGGPGTNPPPPPWCPQLPTITETVYGIRNYPVKTKHEAGWPFSPLSPVRDVTWVVKAFRSVDHSLRDTVRERESELGREFTPCLLSTLTDSYTLHLRCWNRISFITNPSSAVGFN